MSLPALADAHRSTERRLHLDVALRGLLAGILLTCLTSLGGHDPDPFLVATVLVAVVTFDARNPLCLRNLFVAYTVALFGCYGVFVEAGYGR